MTDLTVDFYLILIIIYSWMGMIYIPSLITLYLGGFINGGQSCVFDIRNLKNAFIKAIAYFKFFYVFKYISPAPCDQPKSI